MKKSLAKAANSGNIQLSHGLAEIQECVLLERVSQRIRKSHSMYFEVIHDIIEAFSAARQCIVLA